MTATVIDLRHPSQTTTVLDVVIPVYNEEATLAASVHRVRAALDRLPWSARVTIADNASTDRTAIVGRTLARSVEGVRYVRLAEKGRGRALRTIWLESDSDVLVYMDVDLSTDLNALLPLVAPLISGHSDLAIGSRLARQSHVVRGPKREVVSRSYNLILRGALRVKFSDAQCGFKAIRRDAAQQLLPLVEDNTWFFDTELLVLAERSGLRIHEVPVDWTDDPDSRVDIVQTALDDLRGIARVSTALAAGRLPVADVARRLGRTSKAAGAGNTAFQVSMFVVIGLLSTLAYALAFWWFRSMMSAYAANVAALLVTAIGNTAANRRFTFGVRGPEHNLRHQGQGLAVFATGVAVTSGSLWLLGDGRSHAVEIAVLTVANLAVTVLRFAAMKLWIFRRADQSRSR